MAFDSSTVSIGSPAKKADYDRLLNNTIHILKETATFTGTKTFQSGTVFLNDPTFNAAPDWRDYGYQVNNIGVSGTTTVVSIRQKIYEIGDWDMDASGTVDVTHDLGSDFVNIRSVRAVIRNDINSEIYPLPTGATAGQLESGVFEINSSTITLVRKNLGEFDNNSAFDSTSYNRGWVFVEYIN